jgi:hypothetical protein
MNLYMDPLGDQMTIQPIQTISAFTIELYMSGWFKFIYDQDRQFGNVSVWTRTRTRSAGPEQLATLLGNKLLSIQKCGRDETFPCLVLLRLLMSCILLQKF